jgi:thiol:disulfide interchange protein DsbC
MQIPRRLVALALMAASAMLACSVEADQTTDKIKTTLQSRLGNQVDIKGVSKSPIAGLYEVNLGSDIIYTDANADYVINGEIVDTRTHRNLTEARSNEINRVDFSSLPLADAVKVVKGDGKRKLAVFSDPNCPYCHRLEEVLQSVNNVTVYTFLYPVLSPDSTQKSKAIWCSPDRGKAWEAWMLERHQPMSASCDTSVLDKNLALGRHLNVSGTPTLFLADGTRMVGAQSADDLNQALAAVK